MDGFHRIRINLVPEKMFHFRVIAAFYEISHCKKDIFDIMAHFLHGSEVSCKLFIIRCNSFSFPFIEGGIVFIERDTEKKYNKGHLNPKQCQAEAWEQQHNRGIL